MALKIRIRDRELGIFTVDTASQSMTPKRYGADGNPVDIVPGYVGPLAGMVATVSNEDSYRVKVAANDTVPYMGVFSLGYQDFTFANTPAKASGKLPLLTGVSTIFDTDIYERYPAGGGAALTYAAGDLLYCSDNGLFTKYAEWEGQPVIGVVIGVDGNVLTIRSFM